MSELGKKLIKAGVKNPHKRTGKPLWSGPDGEGPNGGITFSLLSRFLVCRERFRLHVVEGFRTQDQFNHRIEYGNMWHVCEETYLADPNSWELALNDYCHGLCLKYRQSQPQVKHWWNVCKAQFPVYADYWHQRGEDGKEKKTPLLQEYPFDVPYTLPSGRTVRLRGKWDSVDVITQKKQPFIWLQENKTKGDINEQQIQRNLNWDLQTMLYLIAMDEWQRKGNLQRINDVIATNLTPVPIAGVRYNVIRRPLSGGRHTIKQHQPTKNNPGETEDQFYARLQGLIEGEPDYFFMRWNVLISKGDIERFKTRCLNPILEQLCDWWEHISGSSSRESPFNCRAGNNDYMVHWQHPFGVFNPLDEGGSTDVDEYLKTGSMVGLQRTDNLFPELQTI